MAFLSSGARAARRVQGGLLPGGLRINSRSTGVGSGDGTCDGCVETLAHCSHNHGLVLLFDPSKGHNGARRRRRRRRRRGAQGSGLFESTALHGSSRLPEACPFSSGAGTLSRRRLIGRCDLRPIPPSLTPLPCTQHTRHHALRKHTHSRPPSSLSPAAARPPASPRPCILPAQSPPYCCAANGR